ncbi:Protein Star [Folsomia candida]|uniref:Protein Star n=2 Tax=Folsomia candida TaxID=158441 RepID=A0A226ESQ5_FOLCA|nr:Protein Star [Folsomia candida]
MKGFTDSKSFVAVREDGYPPESKQTYKSQPFQRPTLRKNDGPVCNLCDPLADMVIVQENFERMDQFDPRLIGYVRARYVIPPPPRSKPYNLIDPDPSHHKSEFGNLIRKLYKDKKGGVFLEAGSNDGEGNSHTLDLEMNLEWSGLLVECNPKIIDKLKNAGRRAWLATVCLSTSSHPQVLKMSIPLEWDSARLGPSWNVAEAGRISNWTSMEVEAVPLYTVLAAVGLKVIDYMSLDIEGFELPVLKIFPFDKVTIKVLVFEIHFYTTEEKQELKQLLERNSLLFVKRFDYDEIYVHESILTEYGVTLEYLTKL